MFAARKTVVETLVVVHRERGRAFGLEGRQADIFAPCPLELDPAFDYAAHRHAAPDLVEQVGWISHEGCSGEVWLLRQWRERLI